MGADVTFWWWRTIGFAAGPFSKMSFKRLWHYPHLRPTVSKAKGSIMTIYTCIYIYMYYNLNWSWQAVDSISGTSARTQPPFICLSSFSVAFSYYCFHLQARELFKHTAGLKSKSRFTAAGLERGRCV
jgi:hypothetical protein